MRKVKLIVHETYQGKRKSEAVLAGNGAVRYGFAYDAIGNPLQWRDGMTFTWQNGRQLAAFAAGSVSASYTYGEGGIRTAKTVTNADGSVTNITYHTAGGSPLGESRVTTLNGAVVSTVEIQYVYDASGTAYGISAFVTDAENNTTQYNYYYMHNLQGDVIGLWHQYLGPVCYYTYDAWGKLLSVTDVSGNAIIDANHIAHINPLRYRGYYYDTESSLYYLQSRYYDPEVGRFVNADGTVGTGQGLCGTNMFAYCGNNPSSRYDSTGQSFLAAIGIGLFVTAIAALCPSSTAETSFTVEISNWDCNVLFNDPIYGEPNSKQEWYDDNGNLVKERWYGPDGRAIKDRHHTDHGNSAKHPDVPHDHDWGLNEKGHWAPKNRYPTPKESTVSIQITEQNIVDAGSAVLLGLGVYWGAKWIIASILAVPTGGVSLIAAGVMP